MVIVGICRRVLAFCVVVICCNKPTMELLEALQGQIRSHNDEKISKLHLKKCPREAIAMELRLWHDKP
jgi:hypothetical protein